MNKEGKYLTHFSFNYGWLSCTRNFLGRILSFLRPYLNDGKIDLVINIPKSAEKVELDSDYIIRRKAVDLNIPLFTNVQATKRFINSLEQYKSEDLKIKSWDEYH